MSTERFVSAAVVVRATGIGRDRLASLTTAGVVRAYQPGGTGRKLYLVSEVRDAIAASQYRAPDAAARATAAATALLRARGVL